MSKLFKARFVWGFLNIQMNIFKATWRHLSRSCVFTESQEAE